MIAVTLWRLGIAGAALYFAAEGHAAAHTELLTGRPTLVPGSVSYVSTVGVGIGFLALAVYPMLVAGRRHEPLTGWLRGALTATTLFAGLEFAFSWRVSWGDAFSFVHAAGTYSYTVVPALVLVDWLFVGRNQFRTRWWEPLAWTLFPLTYVVYNAADGQRYHRSTAFPRLLVGCIEVGYVLYGAAMLRRGVIGAGEQTGEG